ncbi:LacI family DNA-binding transcriptional regulator [Pullulanibacillus sp. KACC 23026]|uniref:LacI family DNA-binding transcriptional regulator n=1 Tax=Pullulanibacillus sp. KACC 23026 TaxID=3028315 RepID=UPI0023B120F3|nr:LacI family DNA-binding transcriptional regulator [Pullulanibacillus sp. KACC 23026]WEG13499.1 LacI family DNA-binding transcriptional regulator [Pullulanibacillus sp. KACC 23026]
MSITIKDIAKAAGVSYSTVSKALRDSPLVKSPTKKRIKQIANELGYQPNLAARSLVSKRSNTIGVIWPTIERIVLSRLITKINKRLEEYDYTTLISINDVESALQIFNRYHVDAILAFDIQNLNPDLITNVPIVAYGISNQETLFPLVDVNRRKAIYKATHSLYELGHRHISYIGARINDHLQGEKVKGFKEALAELELPITKNSIIYVNDFDQYDGYVAARYLLEASGEKPTAIISGTYELSKGLQQAIHEKNLTIPNDFSIISYDNIQNMHRLDMPLSTVGVPLDTITDKLTELLLDVIDEKEVANKIELEPELTITLSCRPLD